MAAAAVVAVQAVAVAAVWVEEEMAEELGPCKESGCTPADLQCHGRVHRMRRCRQLRCRRRTFVTVYRLHTQCCKASRNSTNQRNRRQPLSALVSEVVLVSVLVLVQVQVQVLVLVR